MIIIYNFYSLKKNCYLGIGDWGLGIGDWAQSPIPNPQSPCFISAYFFINNKLII